MMTENDFVGPARRLADTDLPRIGRTVLGVGEDEMHAVLEVESSGHGFDEKRRPKMLFEPHVFYRHLRGAEQANAVARGLAYARWGERPYPRDSYPHLLEALRINETAALLACSWGLGQILGENYRLCGYATVQAMVHDMIQGEAEQLAAMAAFIKANKLDDELRAHQWAAFARGYNGAGYAKNHYDTRLASAFAKWQRIPDTPWREAAAEETRLNPPAAPPVVENHETLPETAPPSVTPAPVPDPVPAPPPPEQPTPVQKGGTIVALITAIAAWFGDHWWIIAIAAVILVTAIIVGRRK